MNFDIKYQDREYQSIIQPILETEDFHKTKDIMHHGVNRFDHSVRVSYYSYKISKLFRLNYQDTARGGLLHDFFLENHEKGNLSTLINHPKDALDNSRKYFDLSDMEEDIIRTHMFPINAKPPKYLESWIVDLVDNVASVYERCSTMSKQLSTGMNFLLLIMINWLR